MKERDKFGSRLGFILVSAGCAVGLGNVWKFPYICGQNGGAAFILIYLVFLTILGLPILISEFAVGRGSRFGVAKAYEKLEPEGTKWHHFKWFSIFGNYLLMMFYTMVGGWMLFYIYRSASGTLASMSADEVGTAFSDMLASPGAMVGWMILAVLIAFGICALGLQGGMEKIMKVMMSILIILIVILAIHSLVLPNAMEGVKFYLVPNLDAIKSRGLGAVVFDAIKWFSIFGNYLLMMFYTMVGGWMLFYIYRSASGTLASMSADEVGTAFSDMLASPGAMVGWMILAVLIAFGICALGLQGGMEKIMKVMMSILIILIVILAIHSLVLPNAMEGVKFYLVPNLDAIKSRGLGAVVFDAMTHAFFTLSVGIGAMEIFGSYQKREHSLPGEATNIVILDTFVALMAGFIIIPACFAYGVQPDAGPSLLFITLPNVFNNMAGGRIWGTCFFIFMSFAALSTIIAVFENIISFYMDMGGWSRKKAVIFNIVLIIALSLPAVLGFNLLSGFQPMGAGSSVMDLEDFLVSYNLLPLGSMIFVLFCVKKNGWGWENFRKETNDGKGLKISNKLQFYMTYILPAIIVIVYLKGYYDTFAKMGPKVLAGWMTFAAVLLAIIFGLSSVKKKTKK